MVFKFEVFYFWLVKNGFLIKMKKFCLDSGQKGAIAHMGQKESFWKWFRVNEETIFVYKVKKYFHIPMSGIFERGFMLMFKKFGILGALAVGIIGTPCFWKNWSLKIWNNWGAPPKYECVRILRCVRPLPDFKLNPMLVSFEK